jgi:hypothetical protein
MPQNVITPVSRDKPKLLDQVRDVVRRRHFSLRTERTYCDWIKRFILYHGKRHPLEMGGAEVTQFLTHLAREGQVDDDYTHVLNRPGTRGAKLRGQRSEVRHGESVLWRIRGQKEVESKKSKTG